MADKAEHERNKSTSGNHKETAPGHEGGDAARKAQEWGGGSKGSKGSVSKADKHNPNSSAKS